MMAKGQKCPPSGAVGLLFKQGVVGHERRF
jgi:hypothetical protein